MGTIPSGASRKGDMFRNVRDRVGKLRPNRFERLLAIGFMDALEDVMEDIQGVLPTRLESLSVEDGDTNEYIVDFDPKQHYYIAQVPNTVTTVTIAAVDQGGTVSGDGEKAGLDVGTNAFTVTASSVMRPDGYYKIVVARSE